jgi:hypothetical protein
VYTLSKLGDLLHALFSTYKEAFLPVFDQLLPFVVKLLVSKEKMAPSYLNEAEINAN